MFRGRALREQGEQLAADLELARTRSEILGVPHRVLLDLDGRAWRMEWLVTEAEARGEVTPDSVAPVSTDEHLDLAPPRGETPEFRPVPLTFGQTSLLDEHVAALRVETSGGPLVHGAVSIEFERDGSVEPVAIVLSDDDGHAVVLEVEALEDEVQVRDRER
jgi:hypothetical protein